MDEYLEDLFDTDCRNRTHDLLQDYRAQSNSFNQNFELYLDFLIENIDLSNFKLTAGTCLNRIFETVYDLDIEGIQNWKDFIKALTNIDPHYGVKIENAATIKNHRKPPKPKHYHTTQKGYCRYCGRMITKADGSIDKRRYWHENCVNEYNMIYNPADTRKAVFNRDKGVCKRCGVVSDSISGSWEVDHILRLKESNGNLEYFKLSNTQTLCKECHKEKTTIEIHYHKERANG